MSKTPATAAFVLVDVPTHGLKAGCVLQASAATIKSLSEAGQVDAHPDAVSAARERGCEVAQSAIEQAQAAIAAAATQAQAEAEAQAEAARIAAEAEAAAAAAAASTTTKSTK